MWTRQNNVLCPHQKASIFNLLCCFDLFSWTLAVISVSYMLYSNSDNKEHVWTCFTLYMYNATWCFWWRLLHTSFLLFSCSCSCTIYCWNFAFLSLLSIVSYTYLYIKKYFLSSALSQIQGNCITVLSLFSHDARDERDHGQFGFQCT